MYRTPAQVRVLNGLKGVLLAACLLTAVWLIYTTPPDPTAVQTVAENTPEPTSTISATAAPTATATSNPTATPETSSALPTLAPTAVPLGSPSPEATATSATIAIPPLTATITTTTTTVPTATVMPVPTAVLTVTVPAAINGEAEAPPAIIPPALPTGTDSPPLIYYPSNEQTRQATDIDLLGIAQANRTLELLINGEPFALIPVTSLDGRWFYTYPAPPGSYSFTVRYLDAPERTSETILVTLVAPPEGEDCLDPTPGQDLGENYIVGECEWLLGIARKLNVDYNALLTLNPELQNPNFLISGQRLRLPPRTDSGE